MKCLIYTLVTFRKEYRKMFEIFLQALSSYSGFTLCVISDNVAWLDGRVNSILVKKEKTLHAALLNKFDIFKFPDIMTYNRVLFLDCDIIVRDNIMNLFHAIKAKPNKLYVPAEGTMDQEYWTTNAFLPQEIEKYKHKSFNSGSFMFIPNEQMKIHFENAKKFGMNFTGKTFYDQSIFNYYFNRMNIAQISKYMTDKLQMFPNLESDYKDKLLIHCCGIESYKKKPAFMRRIYKKLILNHELH